MRWSRNVNLKIRQKRPNTHPCPTDLLTPPQSHSRSTLTIPWVYSMIDDIKCDNQSNGGTMGQLIPIEEHSTTEHDQNGENDRILWILDDGPPKPLQPTHHHHCLMQSIPDGLSERIKRKHGETMTKMEKKTAHDSHLWTPTPTQQFRPRFSTNIQQIWTQVASIHPSFQCGRNECPYVRIGLILMLSMVNVAGMR